MENLTKNLTKVQEMVEELKVKTNLQFTGERVKMKGIIHKCQANCYESATELEKSEKCASNCYLPLLLADRVKNRIVENNLEKLHECLSKADKFSEGLSRNKEINNCIRIAQDRSTSDLERIREYYLKYSENLEV